MSDALSMSLDERIKLRKKEEQAAKKKGTKPTRKNAIKKAPRKTDRAGRKTKVPSFEPSTDSLIG